MKKLSCRLERYDSYSKEIISFPLDSMDGFSFRIALSAHNHELGDYEVADLEVNLKSLKLNRWSRATFRMGSCGNWDPPLITVTAEVSDANTEPFVGHRSHFDIKNITVDKDREVNVEEVMTKTWFRLIEERDWPLILRNDFANNLISTIEAVQTENAKPLASAITKPTPRKLTNRKKLTKAESNPLTPPKPTNDVSAPNWRKSTESFMI